MPQNRRISFSVPFEHKKVGHFKNLIRDQIKNRKGTENELLEKITIYRK